MKKLVYPFDSAYLLKKRKSLRRNLLSELETHENTGEKAGTGYNARTGKWVNMMEDGIIDPAKVTRSALQNAASAAGMLLTTECAITDIPEPPAPTPAAALDMGGMY